MRPALAILLCTLLTAPAASPAAAAEPPTPAASAQSAPPADEAALRKLIEQIATADDDDREDAEEELIRRLSAPLVAAVGSLDNRPIRQQARIARALERYQSVLRLELARVSLRDADRKLLDDFARGQRPLVEQLFADSPSLRLAAVRRIPLKPDSGAGVLLALKVNDADGDVAEAALESALRLRDEVVARSLVHYVRSATQAIADGFYGPQDSDTAAVVARFVRMSIEVIGAARYREGVPDVITAVRTLAKTPFATPGFFELPPIAAALAELGDRRAAPVLIELLDQTGSSRVVSLGPGRLATVTIGDEVLLSLLRLYEQPPADYGFQSNDAGALAFLDDDARVEGHRRFRLWHRENAPAAPESQPAQERK
ncbi:MAG: hypothetical protein IPM64_03460 [Phycisphaerales bacterium]|nr:hypothetical protein [Phycisphaerales bacterium]